MYERASSGADDGGYAKGCAAGAQSGPGKSISTGTGLAWPYWSGYAGVGKDVFNGGVRGE